MASRYTVPDSAASWDGRTMVVLGGVALAGAVSRSSKGTAATQQRTRAPSVLQNTRTPTTEMARRRTNGLPPNSLFIATLGIPGGGPEPLVSGIDPAPPQASLATTSDVSWSRSDRSVTTFPQQTAFPARPVMCTPRRARRRPARDHRDSAPHPSRWVPGRPGARCPGRAGWHAGQARPRNGGQLWPQGAPVRLSVSTIRGRAMHLWRVRQRCHGGAVSSPRSSHKIKGAPTSLTRHRCQRPLLHPYRGADPRSGSPLPSRLLDRMPKPRRRPDYGAQAVGPVLHVRLQLSATDDLLLRSASRGAACPARGCHPLRDGTGLAVESGVVTLSPGTSKVGSVDSRAARSVSGGG